MREVQVKASKCYDVIIGNDIQSKFAKSIEESLSGKTVMLVSDDNVYALYGIKLKKNFESVGVKVLNFIFPHGEKSKTVTTYARLLEAMCSGKITRSDYVIALGGGVVGDLAGFAAATYQRGIGLIQAPTSLLAAVDSSVGGKTAVDLTGGKNQVGAFYQPNKVFCDTDFLKTLPACEYSNGCAEIIKYAMIGDAGLFDSIDKTQVCEQYEDVIEKCVSMKRDYVEADEKDTGLRMMLNFGHTVGHAVEACSKYSIPHGSAVAIGMSIITKAAAALGHCDKAVPEKLDALIKKYNLPTETEYSAEELAGVVLVDKKVSGDSITLVVPEKIGKCELKKINKNDFIDWLRAGGVR